MSYMKDSRVAMGRTCIAQVPLRSRAASSLFTFRM